MRHESRTHNERLTRRFPLNLVEINPNHICNLAVIASIKNMPPERIIEYGKILINAFANKNYSVQVLFADNTEDHHYSDAFVQLEQMLRKGKIAFTGLSAPTPGKIHGLNKCLEKVRAPYILSVDPNKTPAPGTLDGLYDRMVNHPNIDLLSARVAQNPLRGNPSQYWNAAAAYIGKREFFTGFPPVLNDDEYTSCLTNARGGHFEVANDLTVQDRPNVSSLQSKAEREGRQYAGNLQIENTIIILPNGKEVKLCEYKRYRKDMLELKSIKQILDFILHLPLKNQLQLPFVFMNKLIMKANPLIFIKRRHYLNQLYENPNMCSW